MTPEQIVPLALFVVVVLFNLVGRWLRSRMQRNEAPPEVRPVPLPLPPRVRIVTPPPAPAPAHEEVRRPTPRAPVRGERPRHRRLLGTPADVRGGVVLMAVLGPCRGLQPDGPDGIR